MAGIERTIGMAGAAGDLRDAVTTQAGFTSWWTADAQVKGKLGAVSSFYFEGGRLRVDLRRSEEGDAFVEYTCTRAEGPERHSSFQRSFGGNFEVPEPGLGGTVESLHIFPS